MTAGPGQRSDVGDAEPLLAVKGLTIDLPGGVGQRGLVEDVTFEVRKGQAVALIGESGCGKSLTSMAILGLLPAAVRVAAGSIHFDGVDLLTCNRKQLRKVRGGPVGMVFQEPMSSLNPTMTVGDQIAEVRRLGSYPHEMSGGMQQRVMIAAAIACDPKLLIADEPTTALDVTIQAEILELLRDLRRDLDLAVLLVTHDLGVVADFCDDVVVMYAGHIAERTPVDRLFYEPQHPYSSALLAAVPQAGRARTSLTVIPGRVPSAGHFPGGCRFEPRCAHSVEDVCRRPQADTAIADDRRTRCGRVASGDLILKGTVRG